jgi:hypothetical protein
VAGGRPDGTAVERNAKCVVGGLDLDPLVKPSPQLRPHGTARRLSRIERLVLENIVEQIAHASKMGCNHETFNVAVAPFPAPTAPTLLVPSLSTMMPTAVHNKGEREGE